MPSFLQLIYIFNTVPSPFLQLLAKADFTCEASYFNEKLSVWEPLLEPVEVSSGQLQPWQINAEVSRQASKLLL